MDHNASIRIYLGQMARDADPPLNASVTIPFVSWRKTDVAAASRLVNGYCRALTFENYGRTRQLENDRSRWVSFLGIPECRTADGAETYLHYHCLAHFPPEKWCQLAQFSVDYWRNKPVAEHDKIIYTQVMWGYEPGRLVRFYNTKTLDEDMTIQNTVIAGPIVN